jgi:hypothetical protein
MGVAFFVGETKMKEMWEISILKCYKFFGGRCYNKDIYEKIKDYVELKEEHLKKQYGRPAYCNQIRKHIANLCESGDLRKIDDGYHEITEKGLNRLEEEIINL